MTDTDKPTIQERISSALRSTNLASDAEKRGDADYLGALGLAGRQAEEKAGANAGKLMRLQLGATQSDYQTARRSCWAIAKRLGMKRNWRLSNGALAHIGDLALAHHVFPTCPHCDGLKFVKHENSPYLTGHVCRPCGGSGERPIQAKHNDQIRDVMQVLEGIDLVTGRAVRRLLG